MYIYIYKKIFSQTETFQKWQFYITFKNICSYAKYKYKFTWHFLSLFQAAIFHIKYRSLFNWFIFDLIMVKNYHLITVISQVMFFTVCEIWVLWSTWHAGAVVIVRQTFNENDRYSHKHKRTNHQSRQAALNSCQFASYTPEIYWICKTEKNTLEEKTQQGLKSIRRLEWAVNRKWVGKKFSSTKFNSI